MPKAARKEDDAANAAPNLSEEDIDALKPDPEEEAAEAARLAALEGDGDKETAKQLREQLADTQRRLDEEAAARREADARAATANGQVTQAVNSKVAAQEIAINNRVTAAKTNLEAIKSQLKQAKTAGDIDAEVELSAALTAASNELAGAEFQQRQMAAWKEQQKNAPPAQPAQPPAAAGRKPGEYTDAEKKFLAKYPQFYTSKKFARITKQAAADAEENGHAVDSPGYFRFIEESLQEEGLIQGDGDPLSGAGDQNPSISTAVPPQNSGNGQGAPRKMNPKYPFVPENFRMPPDWVQAASDQGFEGRDGLLEYANYRLEEEAKARSAR